MFVRAEAVDHVKGVLDSIRNNIGATNVDAMVREAERLLVEIKSRDFYTKNSTVYTELNLSVESTESRSCLAFVSGIV